MSVTEVKVKAGALAALAVSVIGTSVLAGTVTDFVPNLPDVLEVAAYSLINAGLVWLVGFRARSVAGKLSPSTQAALETELQRRVGKTLG